MTSQQPSTGGKIIRILAIILFALATFFNLMGGIGTSCVALNPTGWSPSMAKLAPYQWLYILLMIGGNRRLGLGHRGDDRPGPREAPRVP